MPESCVLLEAVLDAMREDRLTAAVFLSYAFQPSFFEDNVLAPLCGVAARGAGKVRRLVLEERLRDVGEVLVVYDRAGLDPSPLYQRVRAVPASWTRGVQHAKHALLLLSGPREALVLLTTSANLTEAGWWSNVEVADVERLEAGAATPLRDDLLGLVALTRRLADTPSPALDAVERFVRERLFGAPGLPRLWLGAEPLPQFLASFIQGTGGRLELLAPYVDEAAAPVADVVAQLSPQETVVFFPRDREENGAALASWRDAVLALPGARFGELASVDRSLGRGAAGTRFVHAKIVRYTDTAGQGSWVLVGSPNLSPRAHAGCGTGAAQANVETAILRRAKETARWLEPLGRGREPAPADAALSEDEPGPRTLPLRVRFHWETGEAHVWLSTGAPLGVSLGAAGTPGTAASEVAVSQAQTWATLDGGWLRRELETTSVVSVWAHGFAPGLVLVEEIGQVHRPSRVSAQLSAADILQHWTLLSAERRAELLDDRLGLGDDPEAPERADGGPLAPREPTMFDAFSGIIHGFLVIRARIEEAIDQARLSAVEAWLLGAQHDSLSTLLDKVLTEEPADPARQIVFALAARELVRVVEARASGWLAEHTGARAALETRLVALERAWDAISTPDNEAPGAFRAWMLEQWSPS